MMFSIFRSETTRLISRISKSLSISDAVASRGLATEIGTGFDARGSLRISAHVTLAHHIVGGLIVFPGVGYFEMALVSAESERPLTYV